MAHLRVKCFLLKLGYSLVSNGDLLKEMLTMFSGHSSCKQHVHCRKSSFCCHSVTRSQAFMFYIKYALFSFVRYKWPYLIITYMTRTLPTSPNTHTIEYNAVMMIATITGVELLSSSAVLSHLELFMLTRLELLLKFRQNTLLFDMPGLDSA